MRGRPPLLDQPSSEWLPSPRGEPGEHAWQAAGHPAGVSCVSVICPSDRHLSKTDLLKKVVERGAQ